MSPRLPGYRLFLPPTDVAPNEWTTKEARGYFRWFIDSVEERTGVLQQLVRGMGDRCMLDLEPDSLFCLGEFFVGQVRTRPMTKEEREEQRRFIDALPPLYKSVIKDEDWELDGTTASLCLDVAMYFGETLRASHPHLEWKLWTRKSHGHNRPVLVGFGDKDRLNPVDITTTIAFRVARGDEESPNGLREVFEVWSKAASSSQ